MKKTLIALLLVGSSSALFAQNTQNTTNNQNPSTPTNNANSTEVKTSPVTNDPATSTDVRTNSNISTDVNTNVNSNMNTDANVNQNSSINSNADMSRTNSVSSGSYNAYGTVAADVPTTVRYSFQKEHPNVTGAQWYQTPNGQLRVMYKDANNQDMDVYYYGTSAQSYMVSLPIRQSLTSDDVVAKAKSMFGLGVYDINRVKAANMEDVYHVRLLDNGQVRSVWISEQGTEVAAADVFRTADVAENDIINEVNTATPAPDAKSNNNPTNSANSPEASGSLENTNKNTIDHPTTPSGNPAETK